MKTRPFIFTLMARAKTHTHIYDLIVIGGGPAGMMAAGRASELGARVLLLEKNKVLGKKLAITGGGRCNITNAEFDTHAFLSNFPQAGKFLHSPFSQFAPKEAIEFFEKQDLPIVVEARKRAFPKSQSAPDVLKAMERYIKRHNVEIKIKMKVNDITIQEDGTFVVETQRGDVFHARKVALATGGAAAPETGSTGDGFIFLKELGHKIYKPNPNIVPLTTDAKWVHSVSGTTLSFMTIRFMQKGKVALKKTGKILFTHFGISAPLILNSAFEVKEILKKGPVDASIDMFPDTEENELDARLVKLFEKNKNKNIMNVLPELIPKKLAQAILKLPEINLEGKQVNAVTKEERKKLVKKLKALTFPITGSLGFEKAVVADGGVALEEVDFKTMTSRLHPNLYLLGDVLNINRPSGGYSLQLCWTTGWVAGTDIGNKIVKKSS